jgi:hypothetical protein
MDFKEWLKITLEQNPELANDPAFRETVFTRPYGEVMEGFGSDWFPNVTMDVAHNALMEGYAAIPPEWKKVVKIKTATDFKWNYVTAFAGYGNMPKVAAGEDYPILKGADGKERWRVEKYGRIFPITMEAQANDQINAFSEWAGGEGGAAANTLNELVFKTLIHDNPTMLDDSKALFHADHSNSQTSSALTAAKIKAAYALMAAQAGRGSEKIRIVPRFLVVDPTNWLTALELTQSPELHKFVETMDSDATAASAVSTYGTFNVFARGGLGLIPIMMEFIPDGYWYLIADPNTCPIIDLGFYRNMQAPELFQESPGTGRNFHADVLQFKSRLICGGTIKDYRGVVKATE